jgi:DNA-binding PadR family transcriptional regulator
MDLPTVLNSEPKPRRKGNRGKKEKRSKLKELLMLLVLNWEGSMGRYRLKDAIGLSEHEGLVKQMLADLKKQDYISASNSGCALTEKGRTLLEKRLKALRIVDIKPFDLPLFKAGPVSIGLHLRNTVNKIGSAMEIRDIAVRGGATGATIILFKEEKLSVPSVYSDILSENPSLVKKIREYFNLENNDVIAIVSADDTWRGFEASITMANALSQKI